MPDASPIPAVTPPRRPLWLLIFLIISTVGLILLSVMMAFSSLFVFDSGDTPAHWAAFYCIMLFPVVNFITIALTWVSYRGRRYRLIPFAYTLPAIYMAVFCCLFS